MNIKFDHASTFPLPIIVDSNGGDAKVAYAIAVKIKKLGKSIIIVDECTSACAEFFLPSAKKVYVGRNVLIGFHHNDFFQGQMAVPSSLKSVPWCATDRKKWLENLYHSKNYNVNFYKQTMERLDFQPPEYRIDHANGRDCLTATMISRYSTWYPTAKQLNDYLGLKIGHPICADDPECWTEKINSWSPDRTTYVIGDTIYTYKRVGQR